MTGQIVFLRDSDDVLALETRIETEDVFALDVRIVTDISPGSSLVAPCNTDDGCAATCASSCASNA